MKILDKTSVLSAVCKATGKFGMFISFEESSWDDYWAEIEQAAPYAEIEQAAPYIKDNIQILSDGMAWLLFDSEKEMLDCYNRTVGNNGPTKLNLYDGPACVYASTCSPTGKFLNENA